MDPADSVQPDLASVAAATAPEGGSVAAAAEPEGQGDTGTTSGLYSLDSVPEDIREQVAPLFKEWDANVTREFQKRAEASKVFEPLQDIPAEDLGHLKTFYELASDPDAFTDWVRQAAEQLGILGPEAGGDAELVEDEEEPTGSEGGALTPERVQQMVTEAIEQDRQQRAQQEQQEAQREEVARTVRETLDELRADFANDERWDEDLVCHYAQRHVSSDKPVEEALRAGYADVRRLLNAQASDALDRKVAQPAATAVTGGSANSAPKKATTFEEARTRTLERLRAANAQ